MTRQVRTVLGDRPATRYDHVLAHEHLLIDISCWVDTDHPLYRRLRDVVVGSDTIDLVRAHPFASPDNVVLSDPDVAVEELTTGDDRPDRLLIIDVTPDTAGADPQRLAEISRRTGIDIVRGCGRYIEKSWSDGAVDPDTVTTEILAAFADPIPAAVIGEIGTSAPMTTAESVALQGAARAQAELGAPLYLHVDPWAPDSQRALDIVQREGADLSRTVVCHQDISAGRDRSIVRDLLDRGVWVAIDIWGDEDAYGGTPMPTDTQRMAALLQLIDDGWGDRLLHSQDVCTKSQLRRFGGPGYLHLWNRIRPRLADAGLTVRQIHDQLAGNALRLLTSS